MTRRAFRALTRHFVGAIVEPPILSDVGIDAFRRTLISAASFFICLGGFLPRIFTKKYRLLSQMPSPEPYLSAWPGDTSDGRRYFTEDLVDPPVTVAADGTLAVPTGAGLGHEVVWPRIERATRFVERFSR